MHKYVDAFSINNKIYKNILFKLTTCKPINKKEIINTKQS